MINMKNSVLGTLLTEPIKRKVVGLMSVMIITALTLGGMQELMNHNARINEAAIENQHARRDLGKVLLNKFLFIELRLVDMVSTDDIRDLDVIGKSITNATASVKSLLTVLQKGGTFQFTLPANLNTINEITEKIAYRREDNSRYVIEVIDIMPKIIEIDHLAAKLRESVVRRIANRSPSYGTDPVPHDPALSTYRDQGELLFKQAKTELLRSTENANKIFYDTNLAIHHLEERNALAFKRFAVIRLGVFIGTFLIGGFLCLRTLSQISRIIGERKKYARDLHHAHDSIRAIMDSMPVGIMLVGPDYRIRSINDHACQLLKLASPDALVGKKCNRVLCSQVHDNCPLSNTIGACHSMETELCALDGSSSSVIKKAITLTLAGEPVILETFVDISHRKKTEKKLMEKQAFINTILESVTAGIVVVDAQTYNIVEANPAALKMIGKTADQVIGSACHDSLCPQNRSNCPVITQGKLVDKKECTLISASSEEVPIIKTASKVRLNGRDHLVESFMDVRQLKKAEAEVRRLNEGLEQLVRERTAELTKANQDLEKTLTELKAAQARLLQSEKMASIGQLAAGVAHEINNPVGFVRSNMGTLDEYRLETNRLLNAYDALTVSLTENQNSHTGNGIGDHLGTIAAVKEEVDLQFIQDDFENLITESTDGLDRVVKIVSDLKNFSHADSSTMEYADLNEGIRSTLNIVWNELKYNAEVLTDLGDLPEIKCFPQRINQVVMNLLVNGAQAFEEKGEIRIITKHEGDYVSLTISDTGKGIPPEHIARIYDPFFTTKEVGKGTGLGLNVVYNVVERHKGRIDVNSRQGEGTTFTIYLPIDPEVSCLPAAGPGRHASA